MSRSRRTTALLLILGFTAVTAYPALAQRGPDPNSPRWKGVVALQELFASEGNDALDDFIVERVSPAVLDEYGEDEVFAWLDGLRSTFAGREMTGAQPEGPYAARLRFDDKVLTFELEDEPPHRFLWIGEAGNRPQPPDDDDDAPQPLTWDTLDVRMVREAEAGFSGAVLVVRDGEIVLNEASGMANAEKGIANTPNTIFAIGSTPIDFTKVGILLLMEDGKVSRSDPITKYFQDVPDDKRGITVEHLMTGASGLRDFHDIPTDRDPDHSYIDRAEAVRRIMAQELLFVPGAGRKHSHSAWGLLAAIVEIASEQTYPQFTKTRIFEPAGMADTGFFGEPYLEPRMAIGYGDVHDGQINAPPYWGPTSWLVMGSGGQVSTTGDMVRFHEALRAGRILNEDSLDDFFGRPGQLLAGGDQYGFEIFYTQGPGSMMVLISNAGGQRTMGDLRDLARDLANLVNADVRPKFSLGVEMAIEPGGVTVQRVVPGSAAERDGLQAGDVLVGAGGVAFGDDPLAVLDPYLQAGKPIPFEIERGGQRMEISVRPNPR